jgi:hypothetical protein
MASTPPLFNLDTPRLADKAQFEFSYGRSVLNGETENCRVEMSVIDAVDGSSTGI